jgi:adenylate kinase
VRSLVLEKKRVLVIGHYSEIVDDDILDKIVVLRLNPMELAQRLLSRGWPTKKVVENVEAELVGVCTNNALSEHPPEKVCEVDVTGKSIDDVVREVFDVVAGLRPCRVYVDWLSNEEVVSYVLSLGAVPYAM